jgi:hypothetical protein
MARSRTSLQRVLGWLEPVLADTDDPFIIVRAKYNEPIAVVVIGFSFVSGSCWGYFCQLVVRFYETLG